MGLYWLRLKTLLKYLKHAISGLSMPHISCEVAPGSALVATGLGLQSDLSWLTPSQEKVVDIFRSLCILLRVALGRAQLVDDFGLYLLGGPRPSAPSGQLPIT